MKPQNEGKYSPAKFPLLTKGHANIDVTQNVYGKSWWEERVDAVTRAVEAVSAAAQNAEKAEAKKDQPESVSNEWVPLWVPQQEA
jgi:hypothetical protein